MSRAFIIGRMTVRQTLGPKRLIGIGLMASSPAAIFLLASAQSTENNLVRIFVDLTVGVFFSVVVPVTALIMAASALGDERRDGTLSFIMLRPISRSWIAAAKLGGSLTTAFGLAGGGALAMGVLMGLRSSVWSFVLPLLIGTFIATTIYVSVFLPLGFLTERATLIGLGFVFIWETAIAGTIPSLATTSPWRIGFAAFVDLAPSSVTRFVDDFESGDMAASVGGSLTRMIVLVAMSILVTSWILRNRDLA